MGSQFLKNLDSLPQEKSFKTMVEEIMPVSFNKSTNNSGTQGEVPAEIKGWNWGAFFWTFIWGSFHGVWLSYLAFIPYVGIIMPIILGVKGNEWAWQNNKYQSIEDFKASQKKWAISGLVITLISIVLFIWFMDSFLSKIDLSALEELY